MHPSIFGVTTFLINLTVLITMLQTSESSKVTNGSLDMIMATLTGIHIQDNYVDSHECIYHTQNKRAACICYIAK